MPETIIFIHGLMGNQRAFKHDVSHLKPKFHCITYDLLGHGEQKGQDAAFTLEALTEQLLCVYEQHHLEKAHLCSLSVGCYISTYFAAHYSDKVQTLCFIGGHYNNTSPLFETLEEYYRLVHEMEYNDWLKRYSSAIFPGHFLNPFSTLSEQIYYKLGLEIHPQIIKEALRFRLQHDLKAQLKTLVHPVLWVMGKHDTLYKSCLYDMDEVIRNLTYIEIPKAGHAANLFRPGLFGKIYENFLMKHQSIFLKGTLSAST
ncbi:alpha/beta fold hydrolase [Paenibacillus chartarius]|uniref:Alpha/beta fold hydrolase n=1 Tax=Paenibacillus chartarius TaxID=747481 RepID=A0ABV6DU80_9BACL